MKTLNDHLNTVLYLQRNLGHCRNDYIEFITKGIKPLYNIDFSLLCPLLFNKPAPASKNFLTSVKEWMPHVLESESKKYFELIITGPTFWEFLDQLIHIIELYQYSIPAYIKKHGNRFLKKKDWVQTNEISNKLYALSSEGFNYIVNTPIEKLVKLLDNEIILGIGDIMEPPSNANIDKMSRNFIPFLEIQKKYRLKKDRDKRDVSDSIFHYSMDVRNICLTLLYGETVDKNLLFVTPTRENRELCISEGISFGRMEKTPFYLRNLVKLQKEEKVGNPELFLNDSLFLSESIIKSLKEYDDWDTFPELEQNRLYKFYTDYISELEHFNITSKFKLSQQTIDEIKSTLSSKQKIKNIIEKAVSSTEKEGRELIEKYSSKIDTSFIDIIGNEKDPILNKIKKHLLK